MNIIVFGDYVYPHYQEALSHGFESVGMNTKSSILGNYRFFNLLGTIKNTCKIFYDTINFNPNLIFLYRVENILPVILPVLRIFCPNTKIFIYHNDDPYRNLLKTRIKSFFFLKCIKYADITYVYRDININEAYEWKAKKVKLFMSHYYSKKDLVSYSDIEKIDKDYSVVFVGHYENDDRCEYIDYLFLNNVNLHIYGPESWKPIFKKNKWPLNNLHSCVYGSDYRTTITNSSIALAFFSKKNRDTYTRRCFEIPIFGTVIAAPRTIVTEEIFEDMYSALLFSSKDELLTKIIHTLSNNRLKAKIAKNGYNLVINGDFSELSRAEMILEDLNGLIEVS